VDIEFEITRTALGSFGRGVEAISTEAILPEATFMSPTQVGCLRAVLRADLGSGAGRNQATIE
jgi:hypothetical protein